MCVSCSFTLGINLAVPYNSRDAWKQRSLGRTLRGPVQPTAPPIASGEHCRDDLQRLLPGAGTHILKSLMGTQYANPMLICGCKKLQIHPPYQSRGSGPVMHLERENINKANLSQICHLGLWQRCARIPALWGSVEESQAEKSWRCEDDERGHETETSCRRGGMF